MASRRETDAVEGRGRGSGGARAAVFVRSVVVSDEWHLILGIASQSPAARFPTLPMASCPARPAPATSQGSGLACEGTTPSHVQMHRSSYPRMHRLDSCLLVLVQKTFILCDMESSWYLCLSRPPLLPALFLVFGFWSKMLNASVDATRMFRSVMMQLGNDAVER